MSQRRLHETEIEYVAMADALPANLWVTDATRLARRGQTTEVQLGARRAGRDKPLGYGDGIRAAQGHAAAGAYHCPFSELLRRAAG